MEFIEVPKGKYFICPKNFMFTKDRQAGDRTYLKCIDPLCNARIVMRDGHQSILRSDEHNHVPDTVMLHDIRLRNILAIRSRTETTALHHIFMEEKVRHNEASLRLPNGFNTVKPMMLRERRKAQPPIPATLEDAAVYLANPSYRRFSLALGPQQTTFFDGIRDGCLFFVSRIILKEAVRSNTLHLHMDASLKVVPETGEAQQLFIIYWMRDHTPYPVVFSLMPNRTRQTYIGVLQYTRQLFGASLVSSVLCDYELALRQAVLEVFAGISLRGCWFHFAKNVFLKAHQLNIQDAFAIRMAMSLPLLPEERISEGIDYVCEQINNEDFSTYMKRQWRSTNISVYGLDHQINNAIESLHGQLLRIIGRTHPNFWVLVQYLQKFEHYKCSNLLRVIGGLQLRKQGGRRNLEFSQRINDAQECLKEDGDLRHFLSVTSHTVLGIERLFDLNVTIDAEGMVPNNAQDVQGSEEVSNIVDVNEDDKALVPLVEMLEIPNSQEDSERSVPDAAEDSLAPEHLGKEPLILPEQPVKQEHEAHPFADDELPIPKRIKIEEKQRMSDQIVRDFNNELDPVVSTWSQLLAHEIQEFDEITRKDMMQQINDLVHIRRMGILEQQSIESSISRDSDVNSSEKMIGDETISESQLGESKSYTNDVKIEYDETEIHKYTYDQHVDGQREKFKSEFYVEENEVKCEETDTNEEFTDIKPELSEDQLRQPHKFEFDEGETEYNKIKILEEHT